jgi:hypothetical protein
MVGKTKSWLGNLSKWLKFNKLKLHVSKTKYLIMTGRRSSIKNGSTILTIDVEQIARKASLNFKQHVDTKHWRKCAKKNGFLGRIQQKLTKTAKINIYNSFISSHLNFCSSILFLSNEEDLKRLQGDQRGCFLRTMSCMSSWRQKRCLGFFIQFSIENPRWILKTSLCSTKLHWDQFWFTAVLHGQIVLSHTRKRYKLYKINIWKPYLTCHGI